MSVRHVVKQGECMLSIAAQYGFSDWELIWKHADNAQLREQRAEATLLAEDDVVVVPDPRPKTLNLATGAVHRLIVHQLPTMLRIRLLDVDESPLGGRKYELSFGDKCLTGQTDGDGWLEQRVPVSQQRFNLVLGLGDGEASAGARYAWDINAGHLDPLDTPSGLVQRLANLGYWPADEDADDDDLPYALRAFQEDHGLEVTGESNDDTTAKLREEHGGI